MMMCPMMKAHGAGGEHGEGAPDAKDEQGAQEHATPPAGGGAEDHSAHHPPE
jgi:hypothetical protein